MEGSLKNIKWSSHNFAVQDAISMDLPVVVKITIGCYGYKEEDTICQDEVMVFYERGLQQCVEALQEESRHHLSIPLNYDHKFTLVSSTSTAGLKGEKRSLEDIITSTQLPVTVRFDDEPGRSFTINTMLQNTRDLGNVVLLGLHDIEYIKAIPVNEGHTLCIPAYMDITYSLADAEHSDVKALIRTVESKCSRTPQKATLPIVGYAELDDYGDELYETSENLISKRENLVSLQNTSYNRATSKRSTPSFEEFRVRCSFQDTKSKKAPSDIKPRTNSTDVNPRKTSPTSASGNSNIFEISTGKVFQQAKNLEKTLNLQSRNTMTMVDSGPDFVKGLANKVTSPPLIKRRPVTSFNSSPILTNPQNGQHYRSPLPLPCDLSRPSLSPGDEDTFSPSHSQSHFKTSLPYTQPNAFRVLSPVYLTNAMDNDSSDNDPKGSPICKAKPNLPPSISKSAKPALPPPLSCSPRHTSSTLSSTSSLPVSSTTQSATRSIKVSPWAWIPNDISTLTVGSIGHCLELLKLTSFVEYFSEAQIDGAFLCELTLEELRELGLSLVEAKKLYLFAQKEWRPRLDGF